MSDEEIQDQLNALAKHHEDIKALSELFENERRKMEEAGDEFDLVDQLQKLSNQILASQWEQSTGSSIRHCLSVLRMRGERWKRLVTSLIW